MTTLTLTDKQFAAIKASISIAKHHIDERIRVCINEGMSYVAALYAERRVRLERAECAIYGTPFPEDGGAE